MENTKQETKTFKQKLKFQEYNMSLASLDSNDTTETKLELDSSPGPTDFDWPTLNDLPSSEEDNDPNDEDVAGSLGESGGLADDVKTTTFQLGGFEFDEECPACSITLNEKKASRHFGAICHRTAANKMLEQECTAFERDYLINSLTFPENSRSPVKQKSADAKTLELLDNMPNHSAPFQKGVYPEGYRVLDLDFWVRFENKLEPEPNEPCLCGPCHDNYNGSHCFLEYGHHFRSHSGLGKKKHKEARAKAEKALRVAHSPKAAERPARIPKVRAMPSQPVKAGPKLTSAAELRALPAALPTEVGDASPCMSIVAPLVADVARFRADMSPAQARQVMTMRLVGCQLPNDLKNAEILDPSGELLGAGDVTLRLSRLGPKLQFTNLNCDATTATPFIQGNQTRIFKSKSDSSVVIHMQEASVAQRKIGEGSLPTFFADPDDPEDMFDSLEVGQLNVNLFAVAVRVDGKTYRLHRLKAAAEIVWRALGAPTPKTSRLGHDRAAGAGISGKRSRQGGGHSHSRHQKRLRR